MVAPGAVIMWWRAPTTGKANLEHRQVGRAVEHLMCIAADAGDIPEHFFDVVDLAAQIFQGLARRIHRIGCFGGGSKAGDQLMHLHWGLP